MNERIRKLIVQAIHEVGPDDADRGAKEKTLQKFAELVVEECIGVINKNYVLFGNPDLDRWEDCLREHFGK